MPRTPAADHIASAVVILRDALRIADMAVLADIETECPFVDTSAHPRATVPHGEAAWRDSAAMLNPHEHSAEVLDILRLSLDYARERGLIELHPRRAKWVRVVR